jgi:hypothetical protein
MPLGSGDPRFDVRLGFLVNNPRSRLLVEVRARHGALQRRSDGSRTALERLSLTALSGGYL